MSFKFLRMKNCEPPFQRAGFSNSFQLIYSPSLMDLLRIIWRLIRTCVNLDLVLSYEIPLVIFFSECYYYELY
jgi:hypothetical protein